MDTLPTLVASANLYPTSPIIFVLANFCQLNTSWNRLGSGTLKCENALAYNQVN